MGLPDNYRTNASIHPTLAELIEGEQQALNDRIENALVRVEDAAETFLREGQEAVEGYVGEGVAEWDAVAAERVAAAAEAGLAEFRRLMAVGTGVVWGGKS